MPQAVAWGIPPTIFWQLTPRETNDILKASAAKERRNYAQQAALLYNGALLLGSVIHNPRKIPCFEQAFPGLQPEPRHQDWRSAKAHIEAYREWQQARKGVE